MNAPNVVLSSQARAALKSHAAAMPMSTVTSHFGRGVGTLDMTGLRPILVTLTWNPIDGLLARRLQVPEGALPANVLSGHRDAVQSAVDATDSLSPDPASNVGFSEALEWFGLRGENGRYAERFVRTFEAANPGLQVPMDYLRDLVDAKVSEAVCEHVDANVDREAINALRAAGSFGKGPYAFYATTDAKREARHQAATAYPLLAKSLASKISAKAAIDRRMPLNAALEIAFGADETGKPKLAKPLARRLVGVDWPDAGVPTEVLVDILSSLPPDWFPKDRAEWDAFLDVADTFLRWLPPIVGERPEALAAGCGGRWVDFRDRIAKAATNTMVPDELVDAQARAAWQPEVDASKDGLNSACALALEMVRQFRDLVALPVAASRSPDRDVYLSEETRRMASEASGRVLCRGKSLPAILETVRHWHTQMENILAATATDEEEEERRRREDGPKGEIKVVDADGWAPLCDVFVAPNGVTIMPLTDERELKAEGAAGHGKGPGPDKDGIMGLGHCVGGYAQTCRSSGHHIVSFRFYDGDKFVRLSTAEFNEVAPESNVLSCIQHRGASNGPAPADARVAYEWFVREVANGNIPINRDGIMSYMSNRRRIEDDVTVQAGYDRKNLDLVSNVLSAWGPYFTKRFRNVGVAALRDMPEMEDLSEAVCPSYAPAMR